jgi:hypothetical protein
MQAPPLLPAETLERVSRLARFDGLAALVLGGMFALTAAAGREVPFAVIGLLAAGAGAIELHGLALMHRGSARGMDWIIASQPLLLAVVLAYCALRLWILELPAIPEALAPAFEASAAQWGLSLAEYQRVLNRLAVGAVAVMGLGFQGGMLVYYLRRRHAVRRALEEAG